MLVGDRARWLMKRGADPYVGADLSASRVSVTHHHGVTTAAATSAVAVTFFIALLVGCFVPDEVKVALFLKRAPTPIERRNDEILAATGIDREHPLPEDLSARLALPVEQVGEVDALVRKTSNADEALTGVLDGHVGQPPASPAPAKVLRDFLDYLGTQEKVRWPNVMAEIELQHAITDKARFILYQFQNANNIDTNMLGDLLRRIFLLSDAQRAALYRAGFSPIPDDTNRQYLYTRLPKLTDDQANFFYSYLNDENNQASMNRVLKLLHSRRARVARAALGLIADGRRMDAATFSAVPPNCDVAVPASCLEVP